MTKRKKSYNFWEFFTLVKNDNNKSNAKAVCICCSQNVGGLAIAQVTPECFTSNKARLCRNHLANCETLKIYIVKRKLLKFYHVLFWKTLKKKVKIVMKINLIEIYLLTLLNAITNLLSLI